MRARLALAALTLAVALIAGCGSGDGGATTTTSPTGSTPMEGTTLVLVTHDSFNLSEGMMESFTAETGIAVQHLEAGDAGTLVSQTILTADNPVADVLYGIDNTFLSRALDEDIFIPYEPEGLDRIAAELRAGTDGKVTPVDFGDVCVNYDIAGLADRGLAVPTALADLAGPQYAGTLVVQDPATSSPGLAFLLATIGTFGEEGDYTWQSYWEDLKDNDVAVAADWEAAYYGAFSGGTGEGDRPLVVSYASSPPVEVLFADPPTDTAPTGSMTEGCFRQVEYAGILRGTEHEAAARLLIDFLISDEVQADIPLNMFVFPAVTGTPLPDIFVEHALLTDNPVSVDPAAIQSNRETWIEAWTDLMRG